MVERNLTVPHDFTCFTDDARGMDCPTFPIEGLWGAKKKQLQGNGFQNLYLFRQDFPLRGRILYLDLDVVIMENLDEMVNGDGAFFAARDWWSNDWHGAVMLYESGSQAALWDDYPDGNKYVTVQKWLLKKVSGATSWPEGFVLSYKAHSLAGVGPAPGCKVVSFHGRPKNHEVKDTWVCENWR